MKEEVVENLDKIPLKERQAFQVFLIQSMLNERSSYESDEKWNEEGMGWIKKYGKMVSNIIDNVKNEEIRNLIIRGEYEKASVLVKEKLNIEKI